MPVTANAQGSVVVVTYQIGVNSSGGPILRQRSIPNVKTAATDQDVYDVIQALYGLQQHTVISVRRDNRVELSQA
ncbi:Protein of unknown function (DUF1659) [Acididesulfobacillus acetoxydans]|uniref:DUF1659 domain-containing protein n=1 Tax=Acididesulfobacillus acetoxydans TaxID=1561005 RepID=A0A8S0XD61_9FIRM|nr:DUF1659 domain-containing protein [Acididesulfobacillus acetoxydans]CAA7603166.1 Protein of unknown function (DUF1659) [Acididesulfobacillus acetoxydans]CEJ07606.1 Protein of unknown function (DUF1659) [Acididesulfobacillus acetoxydans]